jgi:hypothetical protein
VLSVTLVAFGGYVPIRAAAIHRVAEGVRQPFDAIEQANLGRVVIFAPRPFIPRCATAPVGHFVFFRPTNDPDLENDVLWVNSLSLAEDKELMRTQFPDRTGYAMQWTDDCRLTFGDLSRLQELPIDGAEPGGTGP